MGCSPGARIRSALPLHAISVMLPSKVHGGILRWRGRVMAISYLGLVMRAESGLHVILSGLKAAVLGVSKNRIALGPTLVDIDIVD